MQSLFRTLQPHFPLELLTCVTDGGDIGRESLLAGLSFARLRTMRAIRDNAMHVNAALRGVCTHAHTHTHTYGARMNHTYVIRTC